MNHFGHFSSHPGFGAHPVFEARNINKDFLKQEAAATGDPARFDDARTRVQAAWAQEDMGHQLNEKAGQKVLNFLYLMEIRSPGFTTAGRLHAIHDLYIGNLLDTKFLGKVNSDTTPAQAAQILDAATEHQEKSGKVYPDLTPEEEAVWNRVKVYHEFPDGFKWVYAIKPDGSIASHIPSGITYKTMHHCGNTPDADSDNQYWELRGPDGKAYLTVILSPEGKIEESKSWGNQPNRHRKMIQPYVKWFFKNKVTGVGHRYDYGYATHNNFGVKDFMGDDPEFIDYVVENKPELLGNTEKRIMFWQGALKENVISVEDIKKMYRDKYTLGNLLHDNRLCNYRNSSKFADWVNSPENQKDWKLKKSVFGENPFDVVCAACQGCPFTMDELNELIVAGTVRLDEFANYDIHLLNADVQQLFINADPSNLNELINIGEQVGHFEISESIIDSLVDMLKHKQPVTPTWYKEMDYFEREKSPDAQKFEASLEKWESALEVIHDYLARTNPPSKVHNTAQKIFGNPTIVQNIFTSSTGYYCTVDSLHNGFGWVDVFNRFGDLSIPELAAQGIQKYLFEGEKRNGSVVKEILEIGRPRLDPIISGHTPKELVNACIENHLHLKLDARNLLPSVDNLGKLVSMYPDLSVIQSVIRPSMLLGYYCCVPKEMVNVQEVVKLTLARINKGEETSAKMLSANGASTIMALGRFPEIMEHVTQESVGRYVFPQANAICYTTLRKGPPLMTEHLVNILKAAFMSYSDKEKYECAEDAAKIFMHASYQYDIINAGDPIFADVYKKIAASNPWGDTMSRLTGYFFYVEIPVDKWDKMPETINPQNPIHGKETFIITYILRGLNNGKHAEDPDFVNYLTDYILDPAVKNPRLITGEKLFRKRPIMNQVKKAILNKIEGGLELSEARADMLNREGLVSKDFVVQAQLRTFDAQSEADVDETVAKQLNKMCNADTLKKYRKSHNFPYFVFELLRANLERYDINYMEQEKNGGNLAPRIDGITRQMILQFTKVADFLINSPKTPSSVAAAKLIGHSGLLEAYRIVSDRLDLCRKHGDNYEIQVANYFLDRINKLDAIGRTRQKYKPEEGELNLK